MAGSMALPSRTSSSPASRRRGTRRPSRRSPSPSATSSADPGLADDRAGGRAAPAAAARGGERRGARAYLQMNDTEWLGPYGESNVSVGCRLPPARPRRVLLALPLPVLGRRRRAWPRGARPTEEGGRAAARASRRPRRRHRQPERHRRDHRHDGLQAAPRHARQPDPAFRLRREHQPQGRRPHRRPPGHPPAHRAAARRSDRATNAGAGRARSSSGRTRRRRSTACRSSTCSTGSTGAPTSRCSRGGSFTTIWETKHGGLRLGPRSPAGLRGGVQEAARRDLAGNDRGATGGRHPQLQHLPPRPHPLRLFRDRRPRPHHRHPGRRTRSMPAGASRWRRS